jgi:hypothetical protein
MHIEIVVLRRRIKVYRLIKYNYIKEIKFFETSSFLYRCVLSDINESICKC